MIPEPIPVAVPPPNPPRVVAIFDVSVTTESLALATTAVMSSAWTVVVPVPPLWAAALAFGDVTGAAAVGWGRASSTTARVDPEASRADKSAAPRIVPAARPRRGVRDGWV